MAQLKLLRKLLNLPTALRVRFHPAYNRLLLQAAGATIGEGVVIPGRLHVKLVGGVN